MKLASRQLRYVRPVLPSLNRRHLRFVGRDNSIQLLETAVVLEGRLQRLRMPLVDRLFLQALSEWTTITIPYSRILDFRYDSMKGRRALLTALCWLPFLLGMLFSAGQVSVEVLGSFGAIPAMAATWFINLVRRRMPLSVLLFQLPDGRRVQANFHITSRKAGKAFADQLESNCAAATGIASGPFPGQPVQLAAASDSRRTPPA